jgi:hypothetical protein
MLVEAARWRANTFSYSRQDACAPRNAVTKDPKV